MGFGAWSTLVGRSLLETVLALLLRWAIVRRGRRFRLAVSGSHHPRPTRFCCQARRRCDYRCRSPPGLDLALEKDRGWVQASVVWPTLGLHPPCWVDEHPQPFRSSAPLPHHSPLAVADCPPHCRRRRPPPAAAACLPHQRVSSAGRINTCLPSCGGWLRGQARPNSALNAAHHLLG